MILGTKARYAVMALVDLQKNSNGRPVTLSDIAMRQEVSLPYLEQIFAKLRRDGVVRAVRGPGGGYMLMRPGSETSIAEIVDAVNEPLKMTRCEKHDTSGCMSDKSRCLTHDLWEGLGDHIHEYLSSISLEDVSERRLRRMPQPSRSIAELLAVPA